MKTLYGGCGVEGCLDCLPLFMVDDDGIQHEIENEETCPHGMALWLCAHPTNHYPTREMEMRGEYF